MKKPNSKDFHELKQCSQFKKNQELENVRDSIRCSQIWKKVMKLKHSREFKEYLPSWKIYSLIQKSLRIWEKCSRKQKCSQIPKKCEIEKIFVILKKKKEMKKPGKNTQKKRRSVREGSRTFWKPERGSY